MKKLIALLVCLVLFATGCQHTQPDSYSKYTHTVLGAFDTVVTLTCYAESQAAFDAVCEKFDSELWRLHTIFDRFEAHENVNGLWALNAAKGEWQRVEPELYSLLSQCANWATIDGGRINIALGSVIDLWKQYRSEAAAVPSQEELETAALHSAATLELDGSSCARVSDPETVIDLGAVAKGWCVERLAALLDELSPDYLIDAGGNVRMGSRRHGELDKWRVGITDPLSPTQIKLTLGATDISAVTSGGYQRYYEVDGVRYHHIIDPDTLMPANINAQVTVLCKDSGMADYLSTALFLLPYEEGLSIVQALEDVDAVWIGNDGTVQMTQGALDMVVK